MWQRFFLRDAELWVEDQRRGTIVAEMGESHVPVVVGPGYCVLPPREEMTDGDELDPPVILVNLEAICGVAEIFSTVRSTKIFSEAGRRSESDRRTDRPTGPPTTPTPDLQPGEPS